MTSDGAARWRLSRRDLVAGGVAVGSSAGLVAAATPAWRGRVERAGERLLIHDGGSVTQISQPCAGVISIVKCPARRLATVGGFFREARVPRPTVRITETPSATMLVGEGASASVDKATGLVSFLDSAGRVRIAEGAAPAPLRGVTTPRAQGFAIGEGEALHGLGQFRDPVFDYRGRDVFLAHANSDAVSPFLLSTGGWGLLWDTGTAAYFRSRGRELAFHSVAGDLVRYYVCLGEDAGAVTRRYRALTGEAAMLPKWAFGYWQSKERYETQAELTAVVDEYRRRGLPLDAIVQDWRYWGENDRFSGMVFDPVRFPDPRAMTDHVHERGVHLLASIWPAFGPNTAIHREMEAAGHLFPGAHWSGGRVFDPTSPDARAIYWKHVKRGLIDAGVDGLWTDGNEPEFMSTGDRYGTAASFARNGRETAGPIDENLLSFSRYQGEGLAEGMRREVPAKRPVILSRSAYPGQQQAGVITWSGDIFASWQTLRNQVVAAINMAASGLPWWTCDIGGFLVTHRFPDGLADPAYRELYVRWFQFGAFLPIFRAHGTQVPRELWQFGQPGEPVFDALEAALRLRYALIPYIYSAADSVRRGGDVMRALTLAFPGDAGCRGREDSYMFGPDLLVRVVDRPLQHTPTNPQEFLPNGAVLGLDAPAASVEFFEGVDLKRPVGSRLTDDLKMTWFGDLPEQLKGKPYSARWTGRIEAVESGRHRLVVHAKGDVRLMIEGRVLVSGDSGKAAADGATGAVSFKGHEGDGRYEAAIELVKGRRYAFRLELRQPVSDAVSLWIEWVTPRQARLATPTGRQSVDVYLPAGQDWYDWRDARRHAGGRTIEVETPLDRVPLFARAGAIVPTAAGLTRATQRPDRLTLRVFAGRNGAFTLYDDAGDGDGYARGACARVPLRWDDAARTLSIGAREGDYPGMAARTTIEVVVEDGRARRSRTVRYDGRAQRVTIG